MYKILCIDGGGMRGVIPARILTRLEKDKGKPISSMFDLLVGTSTGGILAAGLCVPDSTGKQPKYAAKKLLELYEKRGKDIFDRSLFRSIPGIDFLASLVDEIYDHEPLERILKDYFGETWLSESLKPLVITSYDIGSRSSYFFKSSRAANDPDRDHLLRHVVRATTAAPTYFEPTIVPNRATPPTHRVLVDGGVVAGSPAKCGYIEAISNHEAERNQIVLVSLGTGNATRSITYGDAKGWGKLGWAREIVSVFMDGSSDAVNHHLSHLLPGHKTGNDQRYFRFDAKLDIGYDALDNADKTNIFALKKKAEQILRKQKAEYERLKNIL